jgi:hypothetical protein
VSFKKVNISNSSVFVKNSDLNVSLPLFNTFSLTSLSQSIKSHLSNEDAKIYGGVFNINVTERKIINIIHSIFSNWFISSNSEKTYVGYGGVEYIYCGLHRYF